MPQLRWPFIAFVTLCVAGCGTRDPVQEMQKSLAKAPEYMIILEDMREDGSFFTNYYHRYTVVQGERRGTTEWIEVTEEVYRRYAAFLGMALVAKSDKGVNGTPHPPGYHYVGNPQYGHWGGGGSFWVFYGQYAMMRSLMGGGYGGQIYRNDYNDYRNNRDRRRPYFGRNRQYGTEGSVTKKQRPAFYQRRQQAIANRQRSFSQRVRDRSGRNRSGFGSRSRGRFGK
ncbi:MAG: hypothetical protein J4F39_12535 [Candidatus Latescibacteria bacterium]|nr:hypothetical protein [Candidatus Latescibacterota bacterium]